MAAKKKGFAAMDPEKRRAAAAKGAEALHASGKAHEFTPEEAKKAGHKGRGGGPQTADEMATAPLSVPRGTT
jgi:general stress protein YciG